jgi:hypothetical protein
VSDDQFDAEVVSSFSGAAVGPLIRGQGGAAHARASASLVYVLSALALIPVLGLIFAFAALAVALLDLTSSRRGARAGLLAAAVATMASVVITMLVI